MSERAATAAVSPTQAVAQTSTLHRRCACGSHSLGGAECTNCRDKRTAASRRGFGRPRHAVAPVIVHDALRAPGQPMDAETQAFMESRFERDFSSVRVHTDAQAAASARAVQAHAYTVAQDIVFAAGQYRPDTFPGRHLLAHELAHVAQARPGAARAQSTLTPGALTISDPADADERAADRAADAAMHGDRATPAPAAAAAGVTTANLYRDAEDDAATGPGTTPADLDPGPEYAPYAGCDPYRQALEASRSDAARLAGHAAELLGADNLQPVAELLSAHFHIDIAQPEGRAAIPLVRDQFARMQAGLASNITIVCRSPPSPSSGLTPTMPVDESCRSNDRSTPLGSANNCADNDPRARVRLCENALIEIVVPLKQVLLHEFAHIACNGTPRIAGAGAEIYYADGRRIPTDEANIITQADSYAWFAVQAERVGAAPTGGGDDGPGAGWVAMAVLGGAAMVAGGIGLGLGLSDSDSSNDGLAAGLGIGGLVAGGALLGVGIAGSAGAFDRRRPAATASGANPPSAAPTSAASPSLDELATMPLWRFAQLPESALTTAAPATSTPATTAPATAATTPSAEPPSTTAGTGATMQDYARAWRMVRCIRDFHGIDIDPDTREQLGRTPNAAESAVLGRSLSRIMGHANVGALVRGPGGRGEIGGQALANRVRIVDRVRWGIKRFQLETMISDIGAGADAFVRQWWAEARCGIRAGATSRIVDQERRMAALHEQIMAGGMGEGGFYMPQDDTIYLSENAARTMIGTDAAGLGMAATAGHEMTHMLAGRETTRQAFVHYFPGPRWICYWSAFEEGMAEVTTRDAFGSDAGGSRIYQANVDLMREIMRSLGEDRVRRAYFTGTPDSEIFEALSAGLQNHMDPGLPPVCHTPETTP